MLDKYPLPSRSLQSLFDHSIDCVKLLSPEGSLIWMNQGGLCAMQLSSFEQIRGWEWADLWPSETADMIRATYRGTASPQHLTAACPTAKGEPRWWDVSVVPLEGEDGRIDHYLAISRDVTERERLRETRDVLIQEMRHRQGNTLALAGTLMQAHGISHPEAKGFINDMSVRLAALGRAQNVVGAANGSAEQIGLQNLVDVLIRPLKGPSCSLDIAIETQETLHPKYLDMVGVILSELAVNSTKHGALGSGGRVRIEARQGTAGLELGWIEMSLRRVTQSSREGGNGLRLMKRIASVNGVDFTLSWHGFGPELRLTFPQEIHDAA